MEVLARGARRQAAVILAYVAGGLLLASTLALAGAWIGQELQVAAESSSP